MGDTRMWHWDAVVALDSRLPKWEGLAVSGHREQCPQNLAGTQLREGPAQPWSLRCPFQNPREPNRDNLLTAP